MDTTAHSGSRKGRPNYPIDFKRRLAQQACEPGMSVSRLAREHGINANMLFKWRRHYRAGLLGATPAGRIEIAIADAGVRIEGAADAATARAVLQGLRA